MLNRNYPRVVWGALALLGALVLVGRGGIAFADDPQPVPSVGGGVVAPAPAAATAMSMERIVAVGEKFDIRLDANATTGYSWAIDATPSTGMDKLTVAGENYEMASQDTQRAGAPGVQVFHLVAAAPGEARIYFIYRRPWMPNAYERIVEARITIR